MKREELKKIEHLFKEHYRSYRMLSYSYVGQWDVAEDIVQDVFVRILINSDTSKILNINAYVQKAIKNNSIKYISRNEKLESVDEICWEIPNPKESQSDQEQRTVVLQDSIKKLPLRCKTVLELCAFDGYKYKSAADQLGVSVNTVKTQMKRAYQILRHDLNSYSVLLLFFLDI